MPLYSKFADLQEEIPTLLFQENRICVNDSASSQFTVVAYLLS